MKTSLTLVFAFVLCSITLHAQTVTNTDDSGPGSLRQAIMDANANSGADNITFSIPGTGPHTIQLLSPLPEVTDPVILDGYTQSGAAAATASTVAILMIELDGTNAGTEYEASGLIISAGSSTVRGLVINRFHQDGIKLTTNGNNLVEGNFIGTDVTGSQDLGNGSYGVWSQKNENVIGGTSPGAGNIISSNGSRGIVISGNGTVVQGNFIGTDITGTQGLGNDVTGIYLREQSNDCIIGGAEIGAGNVISDNSTGIFMNSHLFNTPSGHVIQGNFIGTDITGTAPIGNSNNGITIADGNDILIGGSNTSEGNVIAFNGASGVTIVEGTNNAVRSNAIFANGQIGINLGDYFYQVTPNDPGDLDTGPNNYQNFPVLTSVTSDATSTTIEGTLNSIPNTSFTIDFFSNSILDPSGYGEGEIYLGSTMALLGSDGYITFNVTLPVTLQQGLYITSTATSSDNNTSEFSEAFLPGTIQDFPVANDDIATVDEDNSITIDVLVNDLVEEGDTKTVTEVSLANNGSVVIEPNSNLTYTPNPDFFGGDNFIYTLQNGSGESDQALVSIAINGVNDAPQASDDVYLTFINTPVIMPVLNNDTDADDDPLTIINVGTGTSGTVNNNGDNTITYSPNTGFIGQDQFNYTMSDGQGESSMAEVRIVIFGPGEHTWRVNTTDDTNDGLCDESHCSLREAILNANNLAGTDNITFSIPGTGPHTIQLLSPLPEVTDPVILDGYTQSGAAAATASTVAILMIELDGTNAGTEYEASGLIISAGSSTVRGLVINRFHQDGIKLTTNGNNLVEGNFIGTDVTGSQDLGNGSYGVWSQKNENVIGGTSPGAGNIISSNGSRGIVISGNGTVVQGNFIGTDITGTQGLGNDVTGIYLREQSNDCIIGGAEIGAGNVISDNSTGIFMNSHLFNTPSGHVIQGNFIGTDITGTAPIGNSNNGITIADGNDILIGGSNTSEGNVIAFNGASGVTIVEGTNNAVRSNAIFANGQIGINLGDYFYQVTPNDPGDLDTGPNNYQNFPVLTSVTSDATSTTIEGTLNSIPNTTFQIQFFSNITLDPSGYGEGETYLDETNVTTDAAGNVTFIATLPVVVPQGSFITSTTTAPDGSTSEFSEGVLSSDIEPPVLSGVPGDMTVECDGIPPPPIVTATDNVDEIVQVNLVETRTDGNCLHEYTLVRTWTASDTAGNTASANQVITVIDSTPPMITSPTDVVIECDQSTDPSNLGTAIAIDNCDSDLTLTFNDAVQVGACPTESIVTRTWTATDACGNSSSSVQMINIIDTTPPVVTAPADLTIECDTPTDPTTTGVATAIDNCDMNVTVTFSDVIAGGNCPAESIITRTWTATDACGNSSSSVQVINIIDTTPPVVFSPADVTVECDTPTDPSATGFATATDNCDLDAAVTFSDVVAAGVCPAESTITRTWTATDACGNSSSSVQVINIIDTTPPAIAGIPTVGLALDSDPEQCGAVVDLSFITAMDNCTGQVGLSIDPPSGSFFPVGVTSVAVYATDECNNGSSATFDITVNDVESPVITVFADPITLWPPNHKYVSFSTADFVEQVTDNCPGLSINDVIITNVSSDESEDSNGGGDGNTSGDIVIAGNCKTVDLRAERNGGGNGRVYTISLALHDDAGNMTPASFEVHVPKSKKSTAVTDAPRYSVVGCGEATSARYKSLAEEKIEQVNPLIDIYPNPFRNQLNVELDVWQDGDVKFYLISTSGMILFKESRFLTEGFNFVQLDLEDNQLPGGLYFLRIDVGLEPGIYKLLKMD